MTAIFALIDCNNFFVSCERLFRPDLKTKPVVVLSSNDGCVVSRSNEAKALGIPMGAPAFKYRQLFKEQGVVQFSANFELYGDISERLTRLLSRVTPHLEVYSVDEAFLDLSQLEIQDYAVWGRQVRISTQQEVGIPVSLGIAPTKTLAKLASERSKKEEQLGGVLDLQGMASEDRGVYLGRTPLSDVWGIGRRLAPKLKAEGIYTALDLAQIRPRLANQLMGVHGRQLVAELNGQPCHPLEAFGRIRQTIMKGRMFGEDTSDVLAVEAAIAALTAKAAFGLRREGLLARSAQLSLSTNRHKPGYQRQQAVVSFPTPTADTGLIIAKLMRAATAMYNSSASYHRANILLYDLVGQSRLQTDMFGQVNLVRHDASQARLQALDAINARYGHHMLHYAAEDLSQVWRPKHGLGSPRYTTNWDDLPQARPIQDK